MIVVPFTSTTAGQVTRLLEGLGTTADQVADRLRALGVKGQQHECGACPIAELLLRSDLAPYRVNVSEVEVELVLIGGGVEYVDVPNPVGEFIVRFDRGVYLDLVKEGRS